MKQLHTKEPAWSSFAWHPRSYEHGGQMKQQVNDPFELWLLPTHLPAIPSLVSFDHHLRLTSSCHHFTDDLQIFASFRQSQQTRQWVCVCFRSCDRQEKERARLSPLPPSIHPRISIIYSQLAPPLLHRTPLFSISGENLVVQGAAPSDGLRALSFLYGGGWKFPLSGTQVVVVTDGLGSEQ
ncbi:hypothetical protein E3N88_04137 [Mikania micrantha]|uniref:Uncharacterized protein n=1 Tax=Mikania micrantha TaxID=192012 RepID=A0A5N6PTJ8_9ASTR|nr:hypothetical protein E3N88_04137 [Mikania micrantha]